MRAGKGPWPEGRRMVGDMVSVLPPAVTVMLSWLLLMDAFTSGVAGMAPSS